MQPAKYADKKLVINWAWFRDITHIAQAHQELRKSIKIISVHNGYRHFLRSQGGFAWFGAPVPGLGRKR